jgi:hypothetical protein
MHNDRRLVILSSIVRVHNRTGMSLCVLDVRSIGSRAYEHVARIDVNEHFYMPIELLYNRSIRSIFIGVDE